MVDLLDDIPAFLRFTSHFKFQTTFTHQTKQTLFFFFFLWCPWLLTSCSLALSQSWNKSPKIPTISTPRTLPTSLLFAPPNSKSSSKVTSHPPPLLFSSIFHNPFFYSPYIIKGTFQNCIFHLFFFTILEFST